MSLIVALGFLTALPVPRGGMARPEALARSLGFFPVVGGIVGGLLVALDLALGLILPVGVRSALLLVALIAITRGLHFDGLMDVCDGLFGGFTPERRLAIMRDSRVGAFGVLGGVADLLLRYAALASLAEGWRLAGLLLPPILGRWAMVWATVAYPYGRSEGLGAAFKERAGWREVALASVGATALGAVVWWPWGAAGIAPAWLVAAVAAWFMLRRLPGLTGDCYGAINEVVEGVVLVGVVGVAGWLG
jgi:adenosylcobinamide-GDP ribazoletransferase